MAATSLEIAFTRAFNELVQDGTWALTFGGAEVESSSSCSGAPENWPLPTPEEGSDLQRVLDSGEFKCGFPSGLAFSSEVTGKDFLNSMDPSETTGYIVDYWDKIGEKIGDMYDMPQPIQIRWNTTFDSSNDIFTAIAKGEFDSACARFSPDGTWTDPSTSTKYPRSLAFSNMLCTTYLESSWVYTTPESSIDSFEGLVEAIGNRFNTINVCTPTNPTSGTVVSCSLQIGNYVTNGTTLNEFLWDNDVVFGRGFECIGKGDSAFEDLDNRICDAVWGSAATTNTTSYQRFRQPTVTAWSSFFRNENLNGLKNESNEAMSIGISRVGKWMCLILLLLQY